MRWSGVWLPIITPFKNGVIDFASYERLVDRAEPDAEGLIASAECRLPLTRVSDALARDLDRLVPPAGAGENREGRAATPQRARKERTA